MKPPILRYKQLPPDTVVLVWREEGRLIIVVNSLAPRTRARAALRAALRSTRYLFLSLLVLAGWLNDSAPEHSILRLFG